ncbi:MBL fold metallo-hydrolase [Actinacidiphila sp. ITFR-21]|uniref:MBL fold metallo-hydrolase n=1 Tax=Actinacidiphila sp. ITFR-21 TaxID=3075199 RepID=UPI002889572E|nr:MBL fold metallo-hydrolase [Streptomyces sp. ITFR-21]WNI18639.1 MBL fold metallo-hydrolase [Streptomyces sp. ITFR-21]
MTDQRERTPAATRPLGERRTWPRSFADRLTEPLTDPLPGLRELVRVVRECVVRPPAHTLKEVPLLPVASGTVLPAGPGTVGVTWAGHASWVLRIGGLTVLTDPVWSLRIPGTPARITPVGVPWSVLPPVDAVVISHNHYDHLDAPTIRRLPRSTAVFVPAGLGGWFRRRGFTRVTELDWWEAAELGGVRFDFVPARHWSRRTLTDRCRSLWGGWVLSDAAGPRIYFAGDTGYGRFFREIGRVYPGIDLALLPIGGYAPRWMLRPVHTDPEEAVRAFLDVGAAAMAPMHWATFLLSGEPPLEPLRRLHRAWTAAGLARGALWDLPVGGSRLLAP